MIDCFVVVVVGVVLVVVVSVSEWVGGRGTVERVRESGCCCCMPIRITGVKR